MSGFSSVCGTHGAPKKKRVLRRPSSSGWEQNGTVGSAVAGRCPWRKRTRPIAGHWLVQGPASPQPRKRGPGLDLSGAFCVCAAQTTLKARKLPRWGTRHSRRPSGGFRARDDDGLRRPGIAVNFLASVVLPAPTCDGSRKVGRCLRGALRAVQWQPTPAAVEAPGSESEERRRILGDRISWKPPQAHTAQGQPLRNIKLAFHSSCFPTLQLSFSIADSSSLPPTCSLPEETSSSLWFAESHSKHNPW